MLIQVEGKNKFLGQVGQLRGNKAVRITRHVPERSGAGEGDEARRRRANEPGCDGDARRSPSRQHRRQAGYLERRRCR